MAKMTITYGVTDNKQYTVDLNRKFGGYETGDWILFIQPFCYQGIPLTLEIAIRANGDLIFRSWSFSNKGNGYLHTDDDLVPAVITDAQRDTVSSLFSGRIKFDDELELPVGASIQRYCPVDRAKEEALCGKKIFVDFR